MSTAILKITDGTNSVDLLELREGVSLTLWRQAVAQYKGGGTVRQSSLSDGRRLVSKQFAEIRETLQIKIGAERGQDRNISIGVLHKLFALMESASNYWVSDWNNTPVWLESRASCETNTRYALIVTANLADIDDIYIPPFSTDGALSDLTLIIEHEHWRDAQPGTATAVPISAVEAYEGRNLGNVDSTGTTQPATSGVYIGSRRNTSNITHIFTWSAVGGFSANLMNAAVPYDLIDVAGAAPAVNDYVIFGTDIALANSGAFGSLIFDIGTAQTGLTLAWEYWTGAAWAAIPAAGIQDNTNTGGQPLDTTGVNSVVFAQIYASINVAVNGVNGEWIRLRVSAVPGPVVAPTQQNRDIYSVVWPYVDIDSDSVGGDLPALAIINTESQTDNTGTNYINTLNAIRRIVVGLRSTSRGDDFTAYLNCADVQNPANVTVATTALTNFADLAVAPAERAVSWDSAASPSAVFASMLTITIAAPLTAHFYGEFHVFLRVNRFGAGGAGTFSTRVTVTASSGGSAITSTFSDTSATVAQAIDLGTINLPFAELKSSEIIDQIVFDVEAKYAGGVGDLFYFIDLILIPTDEWACDSFDFVVSSNSTIETNEQLEIDSISYPKSPIRTLVYDLSTGYIKSIWAAVKNGPAILQKNSAQRLWFMICGKDALLYTWQPHHVLEVKIERQQRYLGPRGTG